jgi:hypothetical protein
MARPSNWKTPTTAVRIPAHLADLLIAYAQSLENTDQPNLFDDEYQIGQKVYHKDWAKHPAVGVGIIEHLTPYTIYVLWMGNNPESPLINWKERSPCAYGRQFCTKYILPVAEPIQLSIA